MAKDYEAIARRKITSPSKRLATPRIGLYSPVKTGKTTLCMTAPNVLILDPEDGTREYTRTDPNVWPVREWGEVDEVYQYLKIGKHSYDWLAVDGCSKLYNFALRFVRKQEEERSLDRIPGFSKIQDYGKANDLFKDMLIQLDTLNMGLLYTAHERTIKIDDQGNEVFDDEDVETPTYRFVPDLPDGARGALNSIVDVLGRLYVVNGQTKKVRSKSTGEIREVEYDQRRLWWGKHPAYDTGARSEYNIPRFVKDPTVPKLVKLIRTGKAK